MPNTRGVLCLRAHRAVSSVRCRQHWHSNASAKLSGCWQRYQEKQLKFLDQVLSSTALRHM